MLRRRAARHAHRARRCTRWATTPRPPRFAGIAVGRTKFWLFVVTGVGRALAGVFWTLRFASARADNGTGLELAVVAAVLLGGVSIFGGRGGAASASWPASLLLGTLRNALQLANVPANTLTIVTGILLIVSVVAPERRRHASATVCAGDARCTTAGWLGGVCPRNDPATTQPRHGRLHGRRP